MRSHELSRIDVWRTATGIVGIESTALVVAAPRREDALRLVQRSLEVTGALHRLQQRQPSEP
jgi:hypothetical protein